MCRGTAGRAGVAAAGVVVRARFEGLAIRMHVRAGVDCMDFFSNFAAVVFFAPPLGQGGVVR